MAERQYEGAGDRKVSLSFAPEGKAIGGEDYLLQIAIPNIQFHLTTAYAISVITASILAKGTFLVLSAG